MANLLERFHNLFLGYTTEPKEFVDGLEPSERVLLRKFLKHFKKVHDSEFENDVNVLVLLTGGMVTGVHNKPPEEQDIDIAINFSSPMGTSERLKEVSLTESFLRRFLDSNNLSYKQYTGLMEGDGLGVGSGYKGWILIEKERNLHKDSVRGYLSSYPLIRFITDRTNRLRSIEIMLWGVDNPNIEEQLRWQKENGQTRNHQSPRK